MKEDSQLIREALAGETESFGQLIRKYQDRLFNTVLHVAGARELAEDLVQDAFVTAFTKLRTFQGQSAFYTWLYRIAFNLLIDHRRKKRPATSLDQRREANGDEPTDHAESAEEVVLRKERAMQVREALSQLSDEFRSILVLREMEGCCYETIAEIMEIPTGTVRSRLHRARTELRELLRGTLAETGAEQGGHDD